MSDIFNATINFLKKKNIKILHEDIRPWGGFFVISDCNSRDFINIYFNGLIKKKLKVSTKLSFKILIIAPNKRLSWQYHGRRSEVWMVKTGTIKVVTSHDDIERKKRILKKGDKISINQGERHRIIGMDDYAVVAEIWIHTDKDNPSDEDDIVRLESDYDR